MALEVDGRELEGEFLRSAKLVNIRYGRESATDEEIIHAAKATRVDRFVHSLPEGYDTVLDEEASNVSAGEKQLITIARAFVSQPSVLILDEATSSVDTRTGSSCSTRWPRCARDAPPS